MTGHPRTANLWLKMMLGSLLLLGMANAVFAQAPSDDPIILMYHERAPFYIKQPDGDIGGLVVNVVLRVFASADVTFKWVYRPAMRQLKEIKDNHDRICAVGWFRNPDREMFAKFTAPVFQDKQMVAVARKNDAETRKHSRVIDLLADTSLRMGIKLGYSNGGMIDRHAAILGTQITSVPLDSRGLVKMLLKDRFDYVFFPGDEIETILAEAGDLALQMSVVSFDDMPAGSKRHIMCSQRVDDEIIRRLDAAIN